MPYPEPGLSLPSPLPDFQEWLVGLLEEHHQSIRQDIATKLDPCCKVLSQLTPEQEGPELCIGKRLTPDSYCLGQTASYLGHRDTQPRDSKQSGQSANEMRVIKRTSTKLEKLNREITDTEIEEVLHVVDQVQQEKTSSVRMMANTHAFDVIIAWVITLNVVVMVIELEYQTYLSKVSLGMSPSDSGEWVNAQTWFDVVEHLFNAIFVMEILVRFRLLRFLYFRSVMNVIDLSLVLVTSIQMYILKPLDVKSGGQLTLFRMLRFARTVRILKILRLKIFTALRVLVQTCISSMASLGWSMVLLFVIIMMSGIFLCNLLKSSIQDAAMDIEIKRWLYRYYGSSLRATYTLFEVTLSGCWPNYFRPLIERVSGWYAIFVLIYISIVVFAVLRIITAMFLKQTLTVAGNDADMVSIEQKAKMEQTIQKLAGVFKSLDVSGDGLLGFEEFQVIISNPDVKVWLSILDVHIHDVEGLFHLLDDGDGTITYDEFLQGMLRLRGQARSLDLIELCRHCDKVLDRVILINDKVDWLSDAFSSAGLRPPSMTRVTTDTRHTQSRGILSRLTARHPE